MNNEKVLNELKSIKSWIKSLTKLQATQVMYDMPQKERVLFLSELGFTADEIASTLNTSVGTVRVTLSRAKRGKKNE